MGSGTFGEVRTAVHLQTGKPRYAVKVLSKHRIEVDAIRREVQTWQQAQNSKYVAKLEGLFEVGTQTFDGISSDLFLILGGSPGGLKPCWYAGPLYIRPATHVACLH